MGHTVRAFEDSRSLHGMLNVALELICDPVVRHCLRHIMNGTVPRDRHFINSSLTSFCNRDAYRMVSLCITI